MLPLLRRPNEAACRRFVRSPAQGFATAVSLLVSMLLAGGCQSPNASSPQAVDNVGSGGPSTEIGSGSAGSGTAANEPKRGAVGDAVPQPMDPQAGTRSKSSPNAHHHDSVAECPVIAAEDDYVSDEKVRALAGRLLEKGEALLMDGKSDEAWMCADRATDLLPQDPYAHLFRASALASLERYEEASLAISMAVALAPDDPETLYGAGDLYLRWASEAAPASRSTAIASEYANRAMRLLKRKRGRERFLFGNVALLQAEAYNGLGKSAEAIAAAEVAVRYIPSRTAALYEKAVAQFDLHQFAQAKASLEKVLSKEDDNAAAHDLLGSTLMWLGDPGSARHFKRAQELGPDDYFAAQPMSIEEVQAEVNRIVAGLEPKRRETLESVRFDVVDLPTIADLESVSPPFPPTILGLYSPALDGNGASIAIYRHNLARISRTRTELLEQIRDTVLHEIGHAEGLDEDDLRRRRME